MGTVAGWCGLARFLPSICKGIEGTEWEELYFHCRDISKATGAEKPSESQKAKDREQELKRAMKAAKDREEEFYDPARKDNIFGRKQTRLELWEEDLKDPIIALDRPLKCLENLHGGWPLLEAFRGKSRVLQWPTAGWAQAFCKVCGRSLSGRAFGPIWTRGIVCVSAQLLRIGTSQGSMGRTTSSFSSS